MTHRRVRSKTVRYVHPSSSSSSRRQHPFSSFVPRRRRLEASHSYDFLDILRQIVEYPALLDILRRLFQNRLDFLHGVLRLVLLVHVFDSFLLLQLFFILDFILVVVRDGTFEQRVREKRLTPRGSFLVVHTHRSSSRARKGTKS